MPSSTVIPRQEKYRANGGSLARIVLLGGRRLSYGFLFFIMFCKKLQTLDPDFSINFDFVIF